MEANNTTIILKGCIERFKNDNELSLKDSEVFELFSLSQLLKNEDVSFENVTDSITDGGQDGGIDSIILLHNGEFIEEDSDYKCKSSSVTKLIISQCKTENSFKETAIDKLLTTFPVLFSLGTDKKELFTRFNPQLLSKRNILEQLWTNTISSGGRIEVYINYCCLANEVEVSPSFTSKKEQVIALCKQLFSTESVVFNCYSSKELLSLFQEHKKNRSTIVFNDNPLSINYGETGLGFIGLVKLSDYKSFITCEDGNINEELFESNIRQRQGDVDVNKKIKETLENITDRDFWWLNNGITIVAEKPAQMGKKISIENVQIVNGLQTSYSIFNLRQIQENDERSVLVKIIISDSKEITDDIIESTNYQNAVSPALLRATETIQKDIELYFLQKGYYYDRRKNYYKNQGKPGGRIFSIAFLAQAVKAIVLQEPHSARATPTSLLKSDTTYNEIFNTNYSFGIYLNCCLIVSKTHHAILNIDDKQRKNKLVNFKLHISMVATALYLNRLDYSSEQISNLMVSAFATPIFENAISVIEQLISSYQETNPSSNLINIAKSSDFVTYIKNNINID